MVDTTTIQPILQQTIDALETSGHWAQCAAKKAHIAGLQGEKRRLRYLAREARYIVTWTEHFAYDLLCIDISAQRGNTDVRSLLCPRSTMEGVISKLWTIVQILHGLANELIQEKMRVFAKPLYAYVDELFSIIAELQRTQTEYERSDYEYHHISRYQVGWSNVHDKYEEKEQEQGYTDHHD